MVLMAVDIETYEYIEGVWTPILDATKFCLAVVKCEDWKKHKTFYCKQELWEFVKAYGLKTAKRGKVLNIYSHNTKFDSAGYFDYTDNNIHYFCESPFIAAYKLTRKKAEEEGIKIQGQHKEIIKFLDTMSIYRRSLKQVGEIIGLEKLEMPEGELEKYKGDSIKQLKIIEDYCERDTKITLRAIQYIKEKLKKEGVNIKRLYTINQIAIQYLITELKKLKHKETLYNTETGSFHYCKYSKEIHQAYRGGRVEAFRTGKFEKIQGIDVNSLYPYISTKIDYPDLRTERKILEPLTITNEEELLTNIGLSKARIKNHECKIGLIPVRTPTGSHYIKKGQEAIGVWTHLELKEAKKNGHEIIDIEWSIIWDKAETNPFATITPKLYKLRKQGTNFDDFFYKMMMNASYGKLAQTRTGREIIIDDIEKVEEYIKGNYEVLRGIDYNYMYQKDGNQETKSYYAPILPTLINAQARIHMYRIFKDIGVYNLVYTDTDSVYYTGEWKEYPINKEMGGYSEEARNEEGLIWGRKSKRIGENIALAGVSKILLTKEDFDKGEVTHLQMIGMRSTKETDKIGTFEKQTRNLRTQKREYEEQKKILEQQEILTDNNIGEINYFLKNIRNTLVLQDKQ